MQQLEGEEPGEWVKRKWLELLEWLKPNPADSLVIAGLKMIYKALAVLALLVLSPVLLLVLAFIFFAAF